MREYEAVSTGARLSCMKLIDLNLKTDVDLRYRVCHFTMVQKRPESGWRELLQNPDPRFRDKRKDGICDDSLLRAVRCGCAKPLNRLVNDSLMFEIVKWGVQ